MKILISTPAYNYQIHSEMANSLIRSIFDLKERNHSVVWNFPTSSILSYNRNLSVFNAIQEGYDWLLFWDSDIKVEESDFVNRMIETAYKENVDIVGLPCRLKTDKIVYNCARKGVNFENLPEEPFEVDTIGTGIMLISTKLLKSMTPPWFSFVDTFHEKPGFWPEDWNFCERAKTRILADPRFTVTHYGLKGY